MVKRNLPVGMWPRRQRSGKVYYYYSFDRKEKELPLGNNLSAALERYHALEHLRLTKSFSGDLPVIQMIRQFERSEPHPAGRHAATRRANELQLLHEFFAETGNPSVANIGLQSEYERWLTRHTKATGFDSIRLLRLIWRFAQRYGYVDTGCPWMPTSQQRERVGMEIADFLIPYAPTDLRTVLEEILTPQAVTEAKRQSPPTAPESHLSDLGELEFELDVAKLAALMALRDSHREDLAHSLQSITLQHLVELLRSSTRLMHVPPGYIDLTARRRKLISDLRSVTAKSPYRG